MTRQIEIVTDSDLKWFGEKNKWLLSASGWTECRVKIQSVQGLQLTDMSIVQCRMCLSSLSAVGFFCLARKATSETL